MKSFYQLLANTLIAGVTSSYVWFALVFWAYLETNSVVTTSVIGGLFLVNMAFSSFWLGSVVDHNRKKDAMMISSFATLLFFILALVTFVTAPEGSFDAVSDTRLWVLVVFIMFGVAAGNIRNIALPTAVTLLVPEEGRAKANGLIGTMMGITFAITSIASGFILAYGGMIWVLGLAVAVTLLAIVHLSFIKVPEEKIVHIDGKPKKLDIRGTIKIVSSIPGLFALIFFTTFNNFLGGVFMALMDAYGLSLVSVQTWGTMFAVLSTGFILGGLIVAKKGLGQNPLKTLFRASTVMWISCIFFTIQPSIILLAAGMLIWMTLSPFIEATEQTIVQKVVPYERQGRVFGFAQSVEQAASPLTAFLIGPIAQFFFIPFMSTGRGAELIGSWFGTGPARGIALVFTTAGIIGLTVTLFAMRSRSYKLLYQKYSEHRDEPAQEAPQAA